MLRKVLISSAVSLLFLSGCSSKDEVTIVEEKGKFGVLKSNSEKSVKPIYEELSWFDDEKNKNVKVEHPHLFNFHWIHDYNGPEYAIVKYEGKYGIINKDNKMIVKPIYDSISKLYNGFSVVEQDGKFGYLNEKFELVQEAVFLNAREFSADVTFVQSPSSEKWGCITKEMDLKIDGVYDEVYSFNENFARVVKDGKWGFVNSECKEIVSPKYEYVYDFSNDYAKVEENGSISYINKKGEKITKDVFTSGENFK